MAPYFVAFPARLQGHVFYIFSTDGWGTRSPFNPPPVLGRDSSAILGEGVVLANGTTLNLGTSIVTLIAAGVAALILRFVSQQPIWVMKPDRLKNYHGMRRVLRNITVEYKGYYYISPWSLLDVSKEHKEISDNISRWLDLR